MSANKLTKKELALVVSCEHAGNRIPRQYRKFFVGRQNLLASHRGYDVGAMELARATATVLRTKLFCTTISRLLVDPNRSTRSRTLFTKVSRHFSKEMQAEILRAHYYPYRTKVEERVRSLIKRGKFVAHISLHTYTPVLFGKRRNNDVGLLYDPRHAVERRFCRRLGAQLQQVAPNLRVRYNYPYFGANDSFVTSLRQRYRFSKRYLGIEIEVNQRFARAAAKSLNGRKIWRKTQFTIIQALRLALDLQ